MNLKTDILKKKFGKNLIINENLSKYSWFNLGGPADIFFRPEKLSIFILENSAFTILIELMSIN